VLSSEMRLLAEQEFKRSIVGDWIHIQKRILCWLAAGASKAEPTGRAHIPGDRV